MKVDWEILLDQSLLIDLNESALPLLMKISMIDHLDEASHQSPPSPTMDTLTLEINH
jgi:hypothetical protein